MADVPIGIEGADLVELDIISKERLPAVAADLKTAESLVHPWADTQFRRSGPVGNYPDGPSAEWSELAGLLEQALNEGIANLDETAVAIQAFLRDIVRVDEEAQARMDAVRAEMGAEAP